MERYLKSKIFALSSTEIKKTKQKIGIKHDIKLTMLTARFVTLLQKLHLQNVTYVYGALHTGMNDIKKCLEKKVDEARYEFGLSPLHDKI